MRICVYSQLFSGISCSAWGENVEVRSVFTRNSNTRRPTIGEDYTSKRRNKIGENERMSGSEEPNRIDGMPKGERYSVYIYTSEAHPGELFIFAPICSSIVSIKRSESHIFDEHFLSTPSKTLIKQLEIEVFFYFWYPRVELIDPREDQSTSGGDFNRTWWRSRRRITFWDWPIIVIWCWLILYHCIILMTCILISCCCCCCSSRPAEEAKRAR